MAKGKRQMVLHHLPYAIFHLPFAMPFIMFSPSTPHPLRDSDKSSAWFPSLQTRAHYTGIGHGRLISVLPERRSYTFLRARNRAETRRAGVPRLCSGTPFVRPHW